MKGILVQVTEEQREKLYAEKKKSGCSLGWQIRKALDEYWRQQDATK